MSRTEQRSQTGRLHESRDTGKPAIANASDGSPSGCEQRACLRCCRECTYAATLAGCCHLSLVCTNCPAMPGWMRATNGNHCCCLFQRRRSRREVPAEPPDENSRYIPLTQGKLAIVDAADYERVSPFNWSVSVSGKRTYAYRALNGRKIALHRFLLDPPKGMVVDHIDRDGLNNRRSNLRVCTQHQNMLNSGPRGKSSRFKGVCWDRFRRRWVVHVCFNGKNLFLGAFTDEAEAARAYDRKACELFGEYAYLNFPAEIKGVPRDDA
jgi:hypothetical protein